MIPKEMDFAFLMDMLSPLFKIGIIMMPPPKPDKDEIPPPKKPKKLQNPFLGSFSWIIVFLSLKKSFNVNFAST